MVLRSPLMCVRVPNLVSIMCGGLCCQLVFRQEIVFLEMGWEFLDGFRFERQGRLALGRLWLRVQ